MKHSGHVKLAKRLLCLMFVSLFIVLSLSGTVAAEEKLLEQTQEGFYVGDDSAEIPERQFEKMGETETLALYVVKEGKYAGEFFVEQKARGTRWYSNPQSRFSDDESRGASKMALNAQLLLYYYDSDLNAKSAVINSFIGKDNDVQVIVRQTENGAKMIYRFSNLKIAIAVYIELHNDALRAYINTDEIVEQGGNFVTDISLLPYFGSADRQQTGYIVVPDGAGGLIEFSKENVKQPYIERVYGEDLGFAKDAQSHVGEQVHLPVYGLSHKDGGFIGVVSQGAATASINAYVSGVYNSQNNVYTSYVVRNSGKISLGQSNTMWTASNEQFDLERWQSPVCETTYYFLEQQTDYVGMAERYRQYLLDTNQLTTDEVGSIPPLYLEFYGGVMRQTHFLGIPIQRYTKMTTFSQARDAVQYFLDKGVSDTVVFMRNADSAEAKGKLQNKVRLAGGLGGKKALSALGETAGRLFLTYQPMRLTGSGNGFSRFFDTAKRYDRNPLVHFSYKASTYYKDLTVKDMFLMRPELFVKNIKQYGKSVSKLNGVEVASVDLGTILIGNYDKKHYVTRTDAISYMQEALSHSNGAVYAPNAYALGSASVVADIPFGGSELDIVSRSIPFYQIVLSGAKEYSLTSLNLADAMDEDYFLKSIETGAGMKCTLAYDHVDAVIDTPYDNLYSMDFHAWKDTLAQKQTQLQQIFSEIGSREMMAHESLTDGVYCTTFRSGAKVVVNYNRSAVETSYGKVESKSWLIVK